MCFSTAGNVCTPVFDVHSLCREYSCIVTYGTACYHTTLVLLG